SLPSVQPSVPIPPPSIPLQSVPSVTPATLPDERSSHPPAYSSHSPSLPITRTVSRSSPLATLRWTYHPSLSRVSSWNRPKLLARALWRRDSEVLGDDWPWVGSSSFGVGVEDGMGVEARAAVARNVQYLNEVTPMHLRRTRAMLAACELLDYLVAILLIVGLAVEKGEQRGLLAAAEVFLVVVIILNALGMGLTRVRRWRLMNDLKTKAKDWSPSSLSAYLHRTRSLEEGREESDNESQKLRWRISHEGGFWLAYRPLVTVELILPPRKRTSGAVARERDEGEGLPVYVPASRPSNEGEEG
ncbi:hypothetical protein BT69DRAFT_1277587, partial [Atractiella rhizophila]